MKAILVASLLLLSVVLMGQRAHLDSAYSAILIQQTAAPTRDGEVLIDTDGDGSLYDADILSYQSGVDFHLFGAQAFPTDVDNICLVYDATLDQVEWSTASCVGGGADTNAVKTICWDFASLQPIVANDLFGVLEKNAGTNHDIFERAFDDGTDECVAGSFVIPPDADEAGTATLTIWFRGVDITGANAVCWDFKELEIPTAGNVDWDTALVVDALGCTNADSSNVDEHVRDTTTVTLTSNDWDQNEMVFFQVCRDADNGSDDHLGDAYGKQFCIEIPRA